jgi:prephenate dehydrogenase
VPKSQYSTILIVGLGLIGGSLARLIRHIYPDVQIIGMDINATSCEFALDNGIVDYAFSHLSSVTQEPELALICVPIRYVVPTIESVVYRFPGLKVVSDVASVKTEISVPRETLGEVMLIPGHPMAGIEKTGISHSDFKIMEKAKYVVCPQDGDAYSEFCSFLTSLSFQVIEMDAKTHDHVVASVSHLPYLMAVLTANNAQRQGDLLRPAIGQLKSSGFRDTTRVSASDPDWGVDVCVYNREQVLPQLRDIVDQANYLIELLGVSDSHRLLDYFSGVRPLDTPT